MRESAARHATSGARPCGCKEVDSPNCSPSHKIPHTHYGHEFSLVDHNVLGKTAILAQADALEGGRQRCARMRKRTWHDIPNGIQLANRDALDLRTQPEDDVSNEAGTGDGAE